MKYTIHLTNGSAVLANSYQTYSSGNDIQSHILYSNEDVGLSIEEILKDTTKKLGMIPMCSVFAILINS